MGDQVLRGFPGQSGGPNRNPGGSQVIRPSKSINWGSKINKNPPKINPGGSKTQSGGVPSHSAIKINQKSIKINQNQSKSIKINQNPKSIGLQNQSQTQNQPSGSSSDGFSLCLTDNYPGRPLMIAHLLSYAVHVPLLEHLMNLC